MERLLLVRCPDLLVPDEGGEVRRTVDRVRAAMEAYCPWITVVRPGICTLPARGPARLFGGETAVVDLVAGAVRRVDGVGPVEVGVADGLFCAELAAQVGEIVPPGDSAAFLASLPIAALGPPELVALLPRLGLHTLGAFAALAERDVLGRFGAEAVTAHRVARGLDGELAAQRDLAIAHRLPSRTEAGPSVRQMGFWGEDQRRASRAAEALGSVQQLLHPGAVLRARRQGGRNPGDQARFFSWSSEELPADGAAGPWPGRLPGPAPALVFADPHRVVLAGEGNEALAVTGWGLLSGEPLRLSIDDGPWTIVSAWAGPWPRWEGWWRSAAHRRAHLQVVTEPGLAHLLCSEGGRWWLAATYD